MIIQQWKIVRCHEVIDVRDGTHDTPKYVHEGIPLITSKNLIDGEIDFSTASFISHEDHANIQKRSRVDRGDILMAMIGTIGNPVLINFDPHFSIKNIALFKFQHGEVNAQYFYYLLQSRVIGQQFEDSMRGATQKFVSLDVLRNLQIPLPPLDEQKRIANILEEADHARRARRFTQSLSDTFLQEVFVEMFGDPVTNPMGWQWTKVDNLKANIKYSCVGGPFGSDLTTKDYISSPGVPVIRGTNINSITFRDLDFVYVTQEKADRLIQNMAYPKDLIFTQRGTLGQVGYIPTSAKFSRYVISQSQMKLTPNLEKCDPLYIYQYFLTDYAQNRMQESALVTGVPHINLSILREFPVLLPPLELQNKFSDLVTEYSLILHQESESSRQTDHLFQTLLHRAFCGEL